MDQKIPKNIEFSLAKKKYFYLIVSFFLSHPKQVLFGEKRELGI